MLTDKQIEDAIKAGELDIENFDKEECLQPASYDMRLGRWAYTSQSNEKIDLEKKGLLVIDQGEFAVVELYERIKCSNIIAGQLGLRSEFAKRGLLLLFQ